jgi:hypothetical protein
MQIIAALAAGCQRVKGFGEFGVRVQRCSQFFGGV